MTPATPSKLLPAALAIGLLLAADTARATITLTADDTQSTYSTSFLTTTGLHTRRLTMRVGISQFGTISNVTFNVTGANVGPAPAPVEGVPSANAGVSGGTTNSVRISVSNKWTDFARQRVVVTANSSAGLVCSAGPCGSTVIPFNKISWTSYILQTGADAGKDFGSGSFDGSSSQTLIDYTAQPRRSFNITNDWVFRYSNDTLYPAGSYSGRVTFTATMP